MTRRLFPAALVRCILAGLIFSLLQTSPSSAVETGSAATIIEKCIQACGGDALRALQSERRTGTLTRFQSGSVPLEIMTKAPGLWRYDQTFAWGNQVSYGYDGTQVWAADMDEVDAPFSGDIREFQMIVDPQAPLKLAEWYPDLMPGADQKIGDKDAAVVTARTSDGLITELAFDKATGLLLRAGRVVFEDYKPVGAVVRPHKILIGENDSTGFQMVYQFSEIRHDEVMDDTLFQRPECLRSGIEAPLYKHRNQVELDLPPLEACVGVYQHPTDTAVTFTVSVQGTHLMLERTGWGIKMEIIPESDVHFFTRFISRDYIFLKDANGKVTHLQIGTDGTFKAPRKS